jgi:hypothetical protein
MSSSMSILVVKRRFGGWMERLVKGVEEAGCGAETQRKSGTLHSSQSTKKTNSATQLTKNISRNITTSNISM